MPTPFIMPKFDMDQESATVVEWLKQEGDSIRIDEHVLVVETDKVAIDVPAPAGGILARVTANPGDIVPVTTVIAYILADGETTADLPATSPDVPSETTMPAGSITQDELPATLARATPVAARMAREMGIELGRIQTDQSRITKADVERHLVQPGLTEGTVLPPVKSRVSVPATPAARRLARQLAIDPQSIAGTGPRGRVQAADVRAAADRVTAGWPDSVQQVERPAERVPLTGMRRTIAERMQSSFHTAPHIALTVEVDASQLQQTRARMNELLKLQVSDTEPVKITLTALLVRIVAWALARHPFVNASLIGEEIFLWEDVNIGVATAVDNGLIVPVVHNADRLTVTEINSLMRDLIERSRSGRLALEDVQGGTFTISNLGMFGIQQFRAIINPPESAILAVGQTIRKPVVVDELDDVAVRPMMLLTLSADHRVVDGVMAAKFLADVDKAIESPELLLL